MELLVGVEGKFTMKIVGVGSVGLIVTFLQYPIISLIRTVKKTYDITKMTL